MSDEKRIPPFIKTQPILLLTAPASKRNEWLGLKFTWRRWRERDQAKGETQQPSHFDSKYVWEELPDRWAYFSDPSIRLLCVVDDAGMGKSISLRQIQYARQCQDSAHLAIRCEFHQLPHDWRGYLGAHPGTGAQQFLLSQLMSGCGVAATDKSAINALQQLLVQKLRMGQCTLLVDAFDQSNRHADAETAARELAILLRTQPRLRCVVSGRPFAVAHYWETLFAQCGGRPEDQWEMVQLAEFTREQAFDFLGKERAEKLEQVDADVLAMPRDLETILGIEVAELADVRTSADVYWKCFETTLNKAMRDQPFKIKPPTARKLFSLLAYETVNRGLYAMIDNERRGLKGMDFDQFVTELSENRLGQLKRELPQGETLDDLLGTLGALNIIIDPGILSVESDANPNNPVLRQLYFRNRTLQDFLAALWLLTDSTPEDRTWLKQRKYVRGDGDKSQEHKELYLIWKFVCEMPHDAQHSEQKPFLDLSTSLLLPSDHPEYTVRSTEMMWRCWPGLLRMTGDKVLPAKWYEEDLEAPTHQLQREARRLVETNSAIPAAGSSARATLLQFLAEYDHWRMGTHGLSSDETKKAVNKFESGFILVPPDSASSLFTWIGNGKKGSMSDSTDRPIVVSIGRRFMLHQYQVTNLMYGLFDSLHSHRYPFYSEISREEFCPVGFVDWFASMIFARWVGGTLPTEIEWEYGCRASPGANAERCEFSFGNSCAHFDEYGWPDSASAPKLLPVHSRDSTATKRANAWGLFHMHGNGSEWCRNWYADDIREARRRDFVGSRRCLRGFSYYERMRWMCRTAVRHSGGQAASSGHLTLRVSRIAHAAGKETAETTEYG